MNIYRQLQRPWQSNIMFFGATASLGTIICGALMLLAGGGNGSAFWDFPLDDGWIHMVYVRGWLTDGFPSYNPGVAESGFSSPLWLIATMPAYLIGTWTDALALWVKCTSMFFGAVTALGVALMAVQFTGRRRDGIAAQAVLFTY